VVAFLVFEVGLTMNQPVSDRINIEDHWDHPQPFTVEVVVQEADIDSYQHVNNSVYIRWLDECARQNSKQAGIDPDTAIDLGFGMAVRDSYVTYLLAAHLGEKLLVGNWMSKHDGKLRATRQFQIIRPSDGATIARATLDYVCINIKSGRPSKMPELFKSNYQVHESLK